MQKNLSEVVQEQQNVIETLQKRIEDLTYLMKVEQHSRLDAELQLLKNMEEQGVEMCGYLLKTQPKRIRQIQSLTMEKVAYSSILTVI